MKIENIDDTLMENIARLVKESYVLDETAHFNPFRDAIEHYQGSHAHVLLPDEEFDPNDPKYPSDVTLEQYVSEAEKLSDEQALPITQMKVDGNVYGFVIERKGKDRTPRCVKIRTKSVFDSDYMDVIVYKDNNSDNKIFSFYMCKPSRLHRYDKDYLMDLFSQGGDDPNYY